MQSSSVNPLMTGIILPIGQVEKLSTDSSYKWIQILTAKEQQSGDSSPGWFLRPSPTLVWASVSLPRPHPPTSTGGHKFPEFCCISNWPAWNPVAYEWASALSRGKGWILAPKCINNYYLLDMDYSPAAGPCDGGGWGTHRGSDEQCTLGAGSGLDSTTIP